MHHQLIFPFFPFSISTSFGVWILETGVWNDSGVWEDSNVWKDS